MKSPAPNVPNPSPGRSTLFVRHEDIVKTNPSSTTEKYLF
jgi:hypothetical protein